MGHHLEGIQKEKKKMSKKKIGLIVNPVAGMGGRVGLKGSDGKAVHRRALELGASPVSPGRTCEALKILAQIKDEIQLIAFPKEMGEDEALSCGFVPKVIGSIQRGATTPEDTIRAAGEMKKQGVDIILFAGGDGTARNIYDAVFDTLPVLGIPGGVKMHSAVFAANPIKAARLVMDFIRAPGKICMQRSEVMDINEEMVRLDQVSARLYGYMKVPYERGLNQSSKAGSNPGEKVYQDGIALDVIHNMEQDVIYLIAPGTTTRAITDKFGLEGTLLGIDAIKNRKMLARDLNEAFILALMEQEPDTVFKIIITIIGQQGYLLGRGNQQLSPSVIRQVGKENIMVTATVDKILSLKGEPFLVDTGDFELDRSLEGYVRVITDFGRCHVYPVSS
jgi:predicted polyphosphate/ATP-dependent NAD kinase